MDLCLPRLLRLTPGQSLIIDYASGRVSYRAARRRVLAASPKTAAKLAWLMVRRQLAG